MGKTGNDPLVSVIVPCYNYGAFLPECLESVKAQTYSNWECIIIDNRSTDNTREIAAGYEKMDARFKYVFCETKGVSAARNHGIRTSKGAFILPLDADDKMADSYLEKAVSVMIANQDLKLVYCDASLFGHINGPWKLPKYSLVQMLKQNLIFCSALFRRSDYDKTTGYNELFLEGFEDWDFWLTLLQNGGEVHKINEVLFFYRIRQSSRNNSLDLEKQKALRKKIYEDHKELYHANLNLSDVIFENYLTESKYKALLNSADYKFGKFLVEPARVVKRLFKK